MSKLGWIQLIEKRCQLWILEERDRTSKEGTMHETFKTTEAHSAYNCIRGRVPGEFDCGVTENLRKTHT